MRHFWLIVVLGLIALGTVVFGQQPGHPLQNGAISPIGGVMSLMRACEAMQRGHVVEASSTYYLGVWKSATSSQACFGVVYSDASGSTSVNAGSWTWIVHSGMAEVLVDAAASVGMLLTTSASTTRGLAQNQTVVPPVTVAEHNGEIGHLVTPCPGPGRLASAVIHWN